MNLYPQWLSDALGGDMKGLTTGNQLAAVGIVFVPLYLAYNAGVKPAMTLAVVFALSMVVIGFRNGMFYFERNA